MTGIVELRAENVKKIKVVEIAPGDSPCVVIGGDNGQGKTSVIDAIAMAFGGKAAVPSKPIREGSYQAEVVVKLEDLVVTRRFTETGTTLQVTSAEGARYSSPQKMLDDLVGRLSFDPLEFSRMGKREQAESLRELVGLDLSELETRRSKHYQKRTEIGRDLKSHAGQLEGLTKHEDAPDAECSMGSLLDELREVQDHNAKLEDLEENRDGLRNRCVEAQDGIQEKELEIKALEQKIESLRREVEDQTNELKSLDSDLKSAIQSVNAFEQKDECIVHAKIESLEDDNRKVRENAQYDAVREKVRELTAAQVRETKAIKAIDAEKMQAIRDAEFPVEGLGFADDGSVTYNGIPFDQASGAESLRVSVAMAMAMNRKLPVIMIRDGSLMDSRSLGIIHEMAKANGFQVWIERVGDGDECTIVMEDGAIKGVVAESTN